MLNRFFLRERAVPAWLVRQIRLGGCCRFGFRRFRRCLRLGFRCSFGVLFNGHVRLLIRRAVIQLGHAEATDAVAHGVSAFDTQLAQRVHGKRDRLVLLLVGHALAVLLHSAQIINIRVVAA